MRILKNPTDQHYWWIFNPTAIAARVHAAYSKDFLNVIWVRRLDKDETAQVMKLLEAA